MNKKMSQQEINNQLKLIKIQDEEDIAFTEEGEKIWRNAFPTYLRALEFPCPADPSVFDAGLSDTIDELECSASGLREMAEEMLEASNRLNKVYSEFKRELCVANSYLKTVELELV